MSWLKTIYESIVNEIGADDAYNRFYSSIPREDYDEILGGNPAPDKFIQFILNCVRDGKSTKEDAVDAVRAYNGASDLVRQNVLNKFRAGEYEDALDIAYDVKYLSSGGAVLSRKKFAKEGLIKLKENERWIATCTVNYAASNHYFGNSHWCTASDRNGRYDGYEMFRNYTDGSNVLIQFKWKGKVLPPPKDGPEPLDDTYEKAEYDEELGYVGDAIAQSDSMYQVQVSREGYIGQICDFDDNSSGRFTLEKVIGKEMYSVLKDTEMLSWLLKKTNEIAEKEYDYQAKISVLMARKRERILAERERKRAEIDAQVQELNRQKEELVKQKWEEFINAAMYEDPEVVSYMYNRDVNGEYEGESDERQAKTNYATIQEVEISNNYFSILKIGAVFGAKKYVDTDDEDGEGEYIINEYFSNEPIGGNVILIVQEDGRKIDKVFGPYEDCSVSVDELRGAGGRWNRRFYQASIVESEPDGDNTKGFIFDSAKNRIIEFEGRKFYEYTKIDRERVLFLRSITDGEFSEYIIYNEMDGNWRMNIESDPSIYTFQYGFGVVMHNENDNYQTVSMESRGLYGLKVPTMKRIKDLDMSSDFPKDGDVIGIAFGNEYAPKQTNAIVKGESEFIFGMNGIEVSVTNNRRVGMVYHDKSSKDWKNNIIVYEDGKYHKYAQGERDNMVPCDKFGRTEKEIAAKKNFNDWLAKGGHSPEVKAQMDKMWADRNGDDNDYLNGEKAFRDWNDNDRNLDSNDPNAVDVTGLKNVPFFKSIAGDSLDGSKYAALKDPNGYTDQINRYTREGDFDLSKEAPDYIRKNPWYRIGRDGKPIDQPWYDEDEIPANLSDRIVREQKITNGLNKMRSLWDRMGLND